MTKKLFVLKGVTDFAPGSLENTAVEGNSIQLSHGENGYLANGSYTSLPFSLDGFFSLIPSWNAEVPHGTMLEVEVRVASGGQWSHWFSMGRWSPYINRASNEKQGDSIAVLEGYTLSLAEGKPPADTAQIRVNLFTENQEVTPMVRLLAISTNAAQKTGEEEGCCDRVLESPAYSCLVRDPGIAGRIASATSLTMLVNRWGEDVLPEEVARLVYDAGGGYYGNLAFLSAAGGMYGYECYVQYAGLDVLRQEIWKGNTVGVRVHYRASLLGDEENEKTSLVPVLEGATVDTTGHLVVVRGFIKEEEEEMVLVNDPMVPADKMVERKIPISVFSRIYTGLCLVLHKGPSGAGQAKPVRIVTQMEIDGDEILLSENGEQLKPGSTIPGDISRSTLCYTLSDGVAYASAAQKKFYYIAPDSESRLKFDRIAAAGKKLTIYLVGSRGATWVAEKMVETLPRQSLDK